MLVAMRNALLSGGGGLPYAAEVEYLESTGTQYIDTGIYPDNDTTTELEFAVTGNKGGLDCAVGCSQSTPTVKIYYVFRRAGGPLRRYVKGPSAASDFQMAWTSGTKYHVLFNGTGNSLVVDGETHTMRDFDGAIDKTLILFGEHSSSGVVSNLSKTRIYWLKITNRSTGVIIRDYISVIDLDGVACLYDRVSGGLFHNAGTGVFLTNEDAS